ncbi:circularly permuted type 2 ATP-grasp protein [Acinetobacter qingfengensis]|nr:circularly permuted type 2 ATP-grasp protein [Acinetobacter qingfengensis]KAA8735011.1 circularly permuted type 2 ATP-grasp protein [Acinetobacter qingfengensis]
MLKTVELTTLDPVLPNSETMNSLTPPKQNFFNEMRHKDGTIREEFVQVEKWLSEKSLAEIEQLNNAAKEHFIYEGITFTVYNDTEGTERTIPFDIVPRILEKKQWDIVSDGSKQRVKALNAFLHDIYHSQQILKDGVIPAEQVLLHEAYQPWMLNFDVKGGIYSHISGVDIIRDGTGEFYVLEDNLRTPSGVSYMLECRNISKKLMPDICHCYELLEINHYPQLLKQTLIESTDVDNPVIVILTPGHFNSAYYEHAFLAREMDVPLVGAHDLFVENGKVYLKSIAGRKQVDVIYRRLDDDFLDPLAFRSDSVLGVPGLMSAYRNHSVVIANAPGTGVADDKSIYPYVDDMIRYYLNEQPILKNVPTYQCRKPEELDYVLHHLEQLVVKEAQGSGGYGMLIGPQASPEQIEEFRQKLQYKPHLYIAQPTLALSVSPIMTEQGFADRHIDLRPFVLSSPKETRVVPGGLTRVAMQEGSLVVNSSQGGGVKDTWVVQRKETLN